MTTWDLIEQYCKEDVHMKIKMSNYRLDGSRIIIEGYDELVYKFEHREILLL